jgi:hypothetical protein
MFVRGKGNGSFNRIFFYLFLFFEAKNSNIEKTIRNKISVFGRSARMAGVAENAEG